VADGGPWVERGTGESIAESTAESIAKVTAEWVRGVRSAASGTLSNRD